MRIGSQTNWVPGCTTGALQTRSWRTGAHDELGPNTGGYILASLYTTPGHAIWAPILLTVLENWGPEEDDVVHRNMVSKVVLIPMSAWVYTE